MTLKLFIGNKAYSSWSLRGWLACKQSGLPFDETVIPLFDDAWETMRTSADLAPGGGKVPILWDGATPVWDSLAILEHLNDQTGNTRFWPVDPAGRAMARAMAAEMHSGFMALRRAHPFNIRKIFAPQPPSPEVLADIERLMTIWAQARARFGGATGGGGDFLFGDFGGADIMFAPVVTRLTTYALPVARFADAYIAAITAHPFMQEWIAAAQAEDWVIDRFEAAAQGGATSP